MSWRDLPPLPKALGGVFAGVIGERLIVAGGSYWEGAPWIAGSKKIFVDTIYALGPQDKQWQTIGRLPKVSGYGASFSHDGALWLVGGQDLNGPQNGIVRIDSSAAQVGKLPTPQMMTASATLDGYFYLFGGQPELKAAVRSRDLKSWERVAPWPGPGRFMAQATSAKGAIYLAGGADLKDGQRVFLKDAYRLRGQAWQRVADLPLPVQAGFAAAPGGVPHIFGGSDGTLAPFEAEFGERHPGFSTVIWKFVDERWKLGGLMPYGPVTSTLVEWRGEVVIPGGEDRPAHRSARVIAGKDFHD